jgi:SAM-dependent methyltransferase
MPSVKWNASLWGANYSWPQGGEEWSQRWGGSEAQWFGSLYPRLHRVLPTRSVLEIAPGHGRWSKFLIQACSQYLGIDLNPSCVDVCKKAFKNTPHARFMVNDGLTLDAAEDGRYDLIFSFESLVHAEIDVFRSYVPEIIKKLAPRGIAFLHHSHLADANIPSGQKTCSRAETMSATAIDILISDHNGHLIIQEAINWLDAGLIDCLTLFGRREAFADVTPVRLTNPSFMNEANLIKAYQSPYSALPLG